MNFKTIVFLASVLLFTFDVFAKQKFSLSWENSFLTGAGVLKGEKPDFDFEKEIKGGQSVFAFRYRLNEYFSLGAGSGANVNKLNASYQFWGTNHFSVAMFYVPIFAEVRGELPIYNDLLYVYGGTKIGGSIAPLKLDDFLRYEYYFSGGFLLEPMLGISLNYKKFLLDFGLGYHLQTSNFVEHYFGNYDNDYYYEYEEELLKYPFNLNQFVLKLGFGVLFGKK